MTCTHLYATLLATLISASAALPNTVNYPCETEGRFPDPSDCSSYIKCLLDQDTQSFVASRGSCYGYAFHPEQRTCVVPEKVENCSPRGSRHIVTDARLNSLCSEDTFLCDDCNTVINCVDGKGFVDKKCGEGTSCQYPSSFGGSAACYEIESDTNDCSCVEPNKFILDPFNEHGFYFCPLTGSDPMVHKCPGEMKFDADILDCTNADGIPACAQGGVHANPTNCSQFYTCIQSDKGWVQEILECSQGEMYNDNEMECSDPCGWPSAHFECEAEGRFADPSDCHDYFVCIEDTQNPGTFTKTAKTCPIEYFWDPAANGESGHCVDPEKQSTPCKKITENKCKIPAECGGEIFGASPIPGATDGGNAETTDSISVTNEDTADTAAETATTAEGAATDAADGGDTGAATNSRFAFRPPPNPFLSEARESSIQNVIQLLKNSN